MKSPSGHPSTENKLPEGLLELIIENASSKNASSQITLDTDLIVDLGYDSLDVMNLVMELGDKYGIQERGVTGDFFTVRQIVNYIEANRKS